MQQKDRIGSTKSVISPLKIGALSKAEEPSDWSISSIIHDAADMSVSFDNCEFC